MIVTREFQLVIRQLMSNVRKDLDAETQRLADDAGALAVGYDFDTAYFIRPDGEVGHCQGNDERITFRNSPTALITALLIGAKRTPKLRELVPPRPAQATDCQQCAGLGRFPFASHPLCDACGGAGWIAPQYRF